MRRYSMLLWAMLLVACSDVPMEPHSSAVVAANGVGRRALTDVTWIMSSTEIEMINLGQFNGGDVLPQDINDAGQVVGRYKVQTPIGSRDRAFLWQNGVFTDLGTLGGYTSAALAINEAGVIVGWANIEGERSRPVVWQNGQIRELPPPNGGTVNVGDARAINEAGEIVGTYRSRAVKWTATGGVNLALAPGAFRSSGQAINNTGIVMGTSLILSPFGQPPFIWNGSVSSTPSLPVDAMFAAVWPQSSRVLNDAGDYVGTIISNADFTQKGFVVRSGTLHMLPSVIEGSTGEFIFGLGINQKGDVAGLEVGADFRWHPLLWRKSGEVIDLGVGPNGYYGEARGVNNTGLVVGVSATSDAFGPSKASGVIWRPPPPDDTPPVIAATVEGTLGANGWYVSDVQVSWTFGDEESKIRSSSGCETVTLTSDSQGTSYTCTATNRAGLTLAQTVVVKRDVTAPVVAYAGNSGTYTVDQFVSIDCVASDATSGVKSHSCESISRDAYALGAGTHEYSASAVDFAGHEANASTSFNVIVTYAGLIGLTRRFVEDQQVEDNLVKFLLQSQEGRDRGNPALAQAQLKVYSQNVKKEIGQNISADNAMALVELAGALADEVAGLTRSRSSTPRKNVTTP